jgi:NADH:ubiquinone oxidoreductase subunit D
MKSKKIVDIMPTKDEVREILSQVFKAQMVENFDSKNIRNLSVAIFQAWCGRMMLKAFNKIGGEYDKSYSEYIAVVEKAVKSFENEVRSTFGKPCS